MYTFQAAANVLLIDKSGGLGLKFPQKRSDKCGF